MSRSPLFDIYDPGGYLQQQAQFGLLPSPDEEIDPIGIIPFGQQRKPTLSDLMPAEEKKSWLRTLAAAGSSGLAGLGWLLDTPGAVVRGALSGGLGKGVSALWDTSDERVTGRELARQYGLAGKQDNWQNFAGGTALELLLDPLTYGSLGLNAVLGKGAKTMAGRAAQHAGLLDDFDVYAKNVKEMGTREAMRTSTPRELLERLSPAERSLAEQRLQNFTKATNLTDVLDQPLAKMNRVSIPGFSEGAVDLYGKGVGDYVAKTADYLGDQSKLNPYTGPVVRGLQKAFDENVLDMADYDRQWEARTISAATRAREKADRGAWAGLQFDADAALRARGSSLKDDAVSKALRDYAEHGTVQPELAPLLELPEMQRLTKHISDYRDQSLANARSLSLSLNEFHSRAGTGWFPRQQVGFDVRETPQWPTGITPPDKSLARFFRRGAKPVDLSDNFGGRREYTDVVGGTDTLDKLSKNAGLQAALRGADAAETRRLLEEWGDASLPQHHATDTSIWARDASDNRELLDDLGLGFLPVRATGPQPLKKDMYRWVDEINPESADFVYDAPPLKPDHPLMRQARELPKERGIAEANMDFDRVAEIDRQLAEVQRAIPAIARDEWKTGLYNQLGDFLRTMDPQHAAQNVGIFSRNSFNEIAGNAMVRGRTETQAKEMLKLLEKHAEHLPASSVPGQVNYSAQDALQKLGFTGELAPEVLAKQLGIEDIDNLSFNKRFVDDWGRVIERGKTPPELSPLLEKFDDFTKSFKTLALLWPSRYTRDAYSGMVAAATKNAFSLPDWWRGTKIRKGDYSSIPKLVRNLPDYQGLTDDQMIRKFATDAGAQGLGTSTAADELTRGAGSTQLKELFPGAARPQDWADAKRLAKQAKLVRGWNPLDSDWSLFAVRGSSGNRNPILELGDRAAEFTDAGNRYGTYLNQIRKGASPSEARRIADLTQVNYANSTNIERDVLKRIFPFYSYTRGITPLIADQLIDNPAGLMGQTTRVINRAAEPTEESFTPEYLRQSASIPVPAGFPLLGLDPSSSLKRFLTNIDLPWESVVNLFTPGTGNTLFDKIGNTARKTAMNVLGQTNPLVKGPLELATNRQFYSGRQLSDLYSMLEQPLGSPGRVAEQVISNLPGGSRALGTIRQAMDERLTTPEKVSKFFFNALTGLKFQDVDEERTKRLAARDMLNQLLETTPGVRTFENIDIPPDVLAKMPEEQKRMFLLYRIIQSESAKRARDRKKQQMAMDPLQVLGVVDKV